MREYITAHVVANTIRMKRSQFKGTIVVVEGSKDKKVYENFINNKECHIEIAHNKDNSTGAIKILEDSEVKGILAIIDADFWVLEEKRVDSNNIMLTDTHDIETMILQSPVLDRFIGEFGTENKIKVLKEDIRSILLNAGVPLGLLRWLSLKDNLNLKFEEVSFSNFVEKNTLKTNIPKMVKEVKNHSQLHSLDENLVIKNMDKLRDCECDPWHICCGHDLVNIISIGLRKLF